MCVTHPFKADSDSLGPGCGLQSIWFLENSLVTPVLCVQGPGLSSKHSTFITFMTSHYWQ